MRCPLKFCSDSLLNCLPSRFERLFGNKEQGLLDTSLNMERRALKKFQKSNSSTSEQKPSSKLGSLSLKDFLYVLRSRGRKVQADELERKILQRLSPPWSEKEIYEMRYDAILALLQGAKKTFDSLESVSLDEMDGIEFQRFVAHLFERLGYGKAEKILMGRDAGRDVVIHSSDGDLIIIECKHHPKGTIGRPVVQKLHSAVIAAHAKKGFVVTTGHFSSAAIRYADDLKSLIELVDSSILYDMANRARIRVLKKGERTAIYHILPPSQELVEQKAIAHIIDGALSQPYMPYQLAKTTVIHTRFIPVYLLEYNLHEDFSTTVGVIHSVHINRGHILLSGQDGGFIDTRLAKMLTPSSMVENWYPQEKG